MAQQLDLQEQEQIDALKAFWGQYGNLITWVVTLVLLLFAAFNGVKWMQRTKAAHAGDMYGELESAAQAGDAKPLEHPIADVNAWAASLRNA